MITPWLLTEWWAEYNEWKRYNFIDLHEALSAYARLDMKTINNQFWLKQ